MVSNGTFPSPRSELDAKADRWSASPRSLRSSSSRHLIVGRALATGPFSVGRVPGTHAVGLFEPQLGCFFGGHPGIDCESLATPRLIAR
jgi:hypothetical protein